MCVGNLYRQRCLVICIRASLPTNDSARPGCSFNKLFCVLITQHDVGAIYGLIIIRNHWIHSLVALYSGVHWNAQLVLRKLFGSIWILSRFPLCWNGSRCHCFSLDQILCLCEWCQFLKFHSFNFVAPLSFRLKKKQQHFIRINNICKGKGQFS